MGKEFVVKNYFDALVITLAPVLVWCALWGESAAEQWKFVTYNPRPTFYVVSAIYTALGLVLGLLVFCGQRIGRPKIGICISCVWLGLFVLNNFGLLFHMYFLRFGHSYQLYCCLIGIYLFILGHSIFRVRCEKNAKTEESPPL